MEDQDYKEMTHQRLLNFSWMAQKGSLTFKGTKGEA